MSTANNDIAKMKVKAEKPVDRRLSRGDWLIRGRVVGGVVPRYGPETVSFVGSYAAGCAD
jgi:hypothetical protein